MWLKAVHSTYRVMMYHLSFLEHNLWDNHMWPTYIIIMTGLLTISVTVLKLGRKRQGNEDAHVLNKEKSTTLKHTLKKKKDIALDGCGGNIVWGRCHWRWNIVSPLPLMFRMKFTLVWQVLMVLVAQTYRHVGTNLQTRVYCTNMA